MPMTASMKTVIWTENPIQFRIVHPAGPTGSVGWAKHGIAIAAANTRRTIVRRIYHLQMLCALDFRLLYVSDKIRVIRCKPKMLYTLNFRLIHSSTAAGMTNTK